MSFLSNKSRVLVNVLGIPSILAVIYFGDEFDFIPIFSLFVATVSLLAIYEWHKLTKIKNVPIKNLDFIIYTLGCVSKKKVW